MKFPNFIIIGSMKCATTVLWHNLNKHPDINMGKNLEDTKIASTEIRFWNNGVPYRTWAKGIDWYKNLFDGVFCGEKCANYIEEQSTMKRMSEYIPNIKLILCIRNPVDRAYSEYQMQKQKITKPLDMNLAQQRGYLYRGLYHYQIVNHVLPFFPKKNLYVMIQEKMKKDTSKELNKLYKFLGASQYDLTAKKITSEEATNRELDLNKDSKVKNYKVWTTKYEPMSSELRSSLVGYYKPYNNELFKFLGYEIEGWIK